MTRVLMTYPGMIPSVLLCGHTQLEYLAGIGKIEFRSIDRTKLTAEDCGWCDVAFFVRSDSELEFTLAADLKRAGKRVVYVLDDDLNCVPQSIGSSAFYADKAVRRNINDMISLCDVFLSPSANLRRKYGAEKAAAVEEPSLWRQERTARPDGPLRIGFAGSIDRSADFDSLLGTVVKNLLARYKDRILIEFFGAHPKSADECAIRCIPYCDSYEKYQQTMADLNWDIGLAPMPQTQFHACKHYNKFIEYSGFGIAGVFSDTAPYTDIIKNGENGLLCANTPEAWTAAISRLIEDGELRDRIARQARLQAQTRFSVSATALALAEELGDMLTYTAPSRKKIGTSGFLRVKVFLRRGRHALKRHGLRLPAVIIGKLAQNRK